MLNLNAPALRPIIGLVSNIVHYAHPGAVDAVIVDGEWLLRDGKVLTIDEDALLAEAQAVTRTVWERMITQAPISHRLRECCNGRGPEPRPGGDFLARA